jgi:hypothetical protein
MALRFQARDRLWELTLNAAAQNGEVAKELGEFLEQEATRPEEREAALERESEGALAGLHALWYRRAAEEKK